MGRGGGGRGKASSTGRTYDAESTFFPVNLNISIFEFLLTGCFEEDFFSYCANRLTDYSCTYWFDPSMHLETRNYPAFSVKFGETKSEEGLDISHSELLQNVNQRSHISLAFANKIGTRGWTSNPNETSLLVNDLVKLTSGAFWSVITPSLLFFCLIVNFPVLHSMRKIGSSTKLPIGVFLLYMTMMDLIYISIKFTDNMLLPFKGVRLLVPTQFISKSACQTLAMIYSFFKHIYGTFHVGFAIQVLLYAKNPTKYYAAFRRQCANNIMILSVAFIATIDSQFFWTYDLTTVDNFITHTDSQNVFYQCGFSTSWSLNHVFLSYIWPLVDHLIGDLLPFCVPLFTGVVCIYHLLKTPHRRNRLAVTFFSEPSFFKRSLINQAVWIIPIYFMLHGISMLPRLMYYSTKYFLFSGSHPNKVGIITQNEELVGYDESGPAAAIVKAFQMGPLVPGLLWSMRNFEASLCYLSAIFSLLKAALLLGGLTEARKIVFNMLCQIPPCFFRFNPEDDIETDKAAQLSIPNGPQQLHKKTSTKPTFTEDNNTINSAPNYTADLVVSSQMMSQNETIPCKQMNYFELMPLPDHHQLKTIRKHHSSKRPDRDHLNTSEHPNLYQQHRHMQAVEKPYKAPREHYASIIEEFSV